ncbi:MAG TPA: type 1 glutamine amidotransferase [Candidatus Sulfopaludibacter sp.]|jgi:GMP synthase-like glutamine amidotransferase|nr:type 1 glutamine amidotransferase [Candidatus Sulfopaludibacter sp.]
MRLLAFRHVPFEGIGLIREALAGVEIDYADLYLDGVPHPDPTAYDALIFLGGPMSVNDDLAFLHEELAIIRQAAARRQPVLGICLGAQLIAKAMGAAVRRNPVSEIGWFPIHFTQAAGEDLLLGGHDAPTEVFQWHGDTFDLPEGATHLAWSEACRNQAFRLNGLYGFQFHPEVTPEMLADWCVQDANCADVRELAAPIDAHRNAEEMRAFSHFLFGTWLVLVQNRGFM